MVAVGSHSRRRQFQLPEKQYKSCLRLFRQKYLCGDPLCRRDSKGYCCYNYKADYYDNDHNDHHYNYDHNDNNNNNNNNDDYHDDIDHDYDHNDYYNYDNDNDNNYYNDNYYDHNNYDYHINDDDYNYYRNYHRAAVNNDCCRGLSRGAQFLGS